MCTNRDVQRARAMLLIAVVVGVAVQTLAYGFAGGTGEPNDPYQIATAEDLVSIGSDPNLMDRHYVLVEHIDLAGYVFSSAVIAADTDLKAGFDGAAFTGRFNGRGHRITALTIDTGGAGTDFLGLFGSVGEGGHVNGLAIEGLTVSGDRYVRNVGGLAGDNSGLISQCYVTGFVSGGDWSDDVAGLVGSNNGTISQCYATATISGGQFSSLAGLIGSNAGVISQCYATGSVSITRFSDLAGLVDSNTGLIAHSYFLDPSDGGGSDNGLGVPLTDEQMRQAEYFVGWGFFGTDTNGLMDAWFIPEQGYPILTWQTEATGLIWLPQARGSSLEETEAMIADKGLVLGNVSYDFDSIVLSDKVVCLNPNHPVAVGAVVDVLVSLGPCDWEQNAGDGTEANPYEISSPGQLDCLGGNPGLWSKEFVLTGNIDMRGRLYHDAVIPPSQGNYRFRGSFDGRGYEIAGLTILSAHDYVGLFGEIYSGAEVRGLVLTDACLLGKSASDYTGTGVLAGINRGSVEECYVSGSAMASRHAGGLVGYNTGTISACCATGDISGNDSLGGLVGYGSGTISQCFATGAVSGNENIGGLVGYGSGTISQCFATGAVSGNENIGGLVGYGSGTISECFATSAVSGNENIGGLVGYARYGGISDSYATGVVSGIENLGGLVGYSYSATIDQCYANGSVSGNKYLGGLVGYARYGSISETYATGAVSGIENLGGLVGYRSGGTTNGFWDVDTSGLSESGGGTGLTTAEMQTAVIFIDDGWDFAETWMIFEGNDYPRFQWEAVVY